MRFLCDEMLIRLGRWLRAAGHDTEIAADGDADRALVDRARADGRWLLTRDRKLLEIRGAGDCVLLLRGDGTAACAAELGSRLAVDWLADPFSRCLLCNTELAAADRADRAALPPRARDLGGPLRRCPTCGRLYWPGSHVRRMRRRLAELNAENASA